MRMLTALDAGVQDIRITLGGSAVVDGGLGFLGALGCRVLNIAGEPVSPKLNGMMQAEQIDAGGIDPRLERVRMSILCDVQNPLCLLGAQSVSGAEYVMNACGFDQLVNTVDWVVTGEGKSDAQTLCGKLPMMAAAKARRYGAIGLTLAYPTQSGLTD